MYNDIHTQLVDERSAAYLARLAEILQTAQPTESGHGHYLIDDAHRKALDDTKWIQKKADILDDVILLLNAADTPEKVKALRATTLKLSAPAKKARNKTRKAEHQEMMDTLQANIDADS